jgi:hypothetical protein
MPNSPTDVEAGAPNPQGYGYQYAGTQTDAVTSLMWIQGSIPLATTWADATSYCAAISLDDFQDWRLPTVVELVSLVDFSKNLPAFPSPFSGDPVGGYWTSTPWAAMPGWGWAVDFGASGGVFNASLTDHQYVRCVR